MKTACMPRAAGLQALSVQPHTVSLLPRGAPRVQPIQPSSCLRTALRSTPVKDSGTNVSSLSDLLMFESELETGSASDRPLETKQEDPTLRAQAILARASKALAAAREIVSETATDGAGPRTDGSTQRVSEPRGPMDQTRSVLRASLESTLTAAPGSSSPSSSRPGSGNDPSAASPSSRSSGAAGSTAAGGAAATDGSAAPSASGRSAMPSWTDAVSSDRGGGSTSGPMMQRQQRQQAQPQELLFAEPSRFPSSFLDLLSQDAQEVRAARQVELPPLQSVFDLTSASRPPSRHMEAEASDVETSVSAPTRAGQMLQDGSGVLGDGTRWEKRSGEEIGPDGYWKRWTQLSGSSADGTVSWEECWWESSDYKGLRELGAAKKGTALDGSAWNEAWSEKMYHDELTNERMVERTAHKWAKDPQADEWEEQWGEKYSEKGQANKWADKWARQADNVWHERWGEEYDGDGGCVKYTDKWAERLHEGAPPEQWGDKWKESFKNGQGSKHGEVWTAGSDGGRYNRWWNEEHYGNGHVRKYGNSTGGENWDSVEQMDTYYNPIPHFGFDLAIKHSPDLVNIPLLRPKNVKAKDAGAAPPAAASNQTGSDDDGLGSGLDAL